jgi:16S rRNA G966 N2-methylase RsmD
VQNSKKDLRQVDNNGSKSKSKEPSEGFTKTMLKTLIFHQEEHNRNSEWKRTNPNASSKQNNRTDSRKCPGYEGKQNWQRDTDEVLNWRKNDSIPNSESSNQRQNKSPSNDLRRKLDWIRGNSNHSSPKNLSPQSLIDKNNLVFDKRDFLFRDVPKKIREQIQLDEVAKYSVTDMRTADEISNFIAKLDGLNANNIVITDGTACAGGNTISFCKKFKKVQTVELDRNRYDMLMHNLKILGCTNATCYHKNYLELVSSLTQDIVFLDPPWGGPSYKKKDEVELFLGDVPLAEVCEQLKSKTKYVIIKAPTNLNYEKFKAKINGNLQVLHQFRKMLLIVVDYYHHPKVIQRDQVTNDYSKDHAKTNQNENESKKKSKDNLDKDEHVL